MEHRTKKDFSFHFTISPCLKKLISNNCNIGFIGFHQQIRTLTPWLWRENLWHSFHEGDWCLQIGVQWIFQTSRIGTAVCKWFIFLADISSRTR